MTAEEIMIPQELEDQVRGEVRQLKDVQDKFLETYRKLCLHFGGPRWQKEIETLFHQVRREVIPIMEQAGLEHHSVQALCSWAERLVLSR
jgi:hypothetical protein